MKFVYVLYHLHVLYDGEEEQKQLGVYSTRKKAEDIIEEYKLLPGFKDEPDGFLIDKTEVDKSEWKEGYISWKEALNP